MLGRLFRRSPEAKSTAALKDVKFGCRRLLSEAGAANSAAIAGEVIRLWPALGETSRVAFFQFLDSLAPERERVLRAARAYAEASTPEHLLELQDAVEQRGRESAAGWPSHRGIVSFQLDRHLLDPDIDPGD